MQYNYTSKGRYLTESELQLIERWQNKEWLSNREITYHLEKAPQTINNEVKRRMIQLKTKRKYSSKFAQATYNKKHKNSKRPTNLTVELNKIISQAVKEKVSLEVIHQEIKTVVWCTLYNWIASGMLELSILSIENLRNRG